MAGDVIELGSGSGRVRIEGLRTTIRALQLAGADMGDMRDLMHALGSIVVNASNPPALSGNLEATVRAGRGKTKAVVRAGGKRAPYAGVIHYGWPARGIPANPFLTNALQSQRGEVLAALERGLEDIQRKRNLK